MRTGLFARANLLCLAAAGCLALASPAAAGAADGALKEANAAYRAAEKAFFAGKTGEAAAEISRTRELLAQAEAADPAHAQIAPLRTKTEKLSEKIARKTASAPAPVSAGKTVPAAPGAALPGGAATLLRDIDRNLERAERALDDSLSRGSAEEREKTARFHLQQARDAFATIQQRHGAKIAPDNLEIGERRERIAADAAGIEEFVRRQEALAREQASASAAARAASDPWIARLRPYVTAPAAPGHDPERYLTPSATMEQEEMRRRLRIYVEAAAALGEYRAAEPTDRTEELIGIEEELVGSLASFRDSMSRYGERELAEIAGKLDETEARLDAETAKAEAGQTFNLLQGDILPDLRLRIERTDIFLESGDGRPSALLRRAAELEKTDEKLRRQRVADTRMRPETYSGPERDALAKKSAEIVAKARPGAKILRTAVVSPDWKEESVIEYTDTTKSALRHRVTRSLTVEVAAKEKGEALLHTLDLSRDRKSDGAWGELYGHIMYSRPILEGNVLK